MGTSGVTMGLFSLCCGFGSSNSKKKKKPTTITISQPVTLTQPTLTTLKTPPREPVQNAEISELQQKRGIVFYQTEPTQLIPQNINDSLEIVSARSESHTTSSSSIALLSEIIHDVTQDSTEAALSTSEQIVVPFQTEEELEELRFETSKLSTLREEESCDNTDSIITNTTKSSLDTTISSDKSTSWEEISSLDVLAETDPARHQPPSSLSNSVQSIEKPKLEIAIAVGLQSHSSEQFSTKVKPQADQQSLIETQEEEEAADGDEKEPEQAEDQQLVESEVLLVGLSDASSEIIQSSDKQSSLKPDSRPTTSQDVVISAVEPLQIPQVTDQQSSQNSPTSLTSGEKPNLLDSGEPAASIKSTSKAEIFENTSNAEPEIQQEAPPIEISQNSAIKPEEPITSPTPITRPHLFHSVGSQASITSTSNTEAARSIPQVHLTSNRNSNLQLTRKSKKQRTRQRRLKRIALTTVVCLVPISSLY